MEGKNLALKFLFGVVLPIALCLGSLFLWSGLKTGIDISGGHSLIFEIRTNEREIERLERDKAREQEILKQARADNQTDKIKDVEAKIKRIDENLKRYKGQAGTGSLAEEMIRILKERIDPQGLRSLEWRPLSNNRIEVRMPAASKETEQARRTYERACDDLDSRNFSPRDLRRVCRAPDAAQRTKVIDSLPLKGPKLSIALNALAEVWQKREATRQAQGQAGEAYENAKAAGTTGAELKKLEEAQNKALEEWRKAAEEYRLKQQAVAAFNVDLAELKAVFDNYLPPTEAKTFREQNEKEYNARQKAYEEGLASLRKEHPSRAEDIDAALSAYKAWARRRQRLEDPADLRRMIAKAGVLEFRIAPRDPRQYAKSLITPEQKEAALKSLQKDGPLGARRRNDRLQWFRIRGDREGFSRLVVAKHRGSDYLLMFDEPDKAMLNVRGPEGWLLTGASSTVDKFHRLAIGFQFDERGAKSMSALTAANKDKALGILLDDEVYSAPTIEAIISSSGIITGRFTQQEVDDLVSTLRAGSLPGRLNPNPVSQSSFGPAIGEVNTQMGIRAAYWGLLAVAVFMLIYYLLAGSIANAALLLNIVLVLGAMSLMDAVFTLPGIAGIILTIGIAVDANVLIFERLREEQSKSQSVAMAIKNAYRRAFSAIFDANITTLITCLILGWVGTDEIRGFAITLGLGVVFSMYTALVVTRWIFEFLLKYRLLRKPVPMLKIIGVPKVNWMGKRRIFWGISALLIVMGIVSLVRQGGDIWGIEFSAGTQAVVKFNDDALLDGRLPDDGIVRSKLGAQAAELGHAKLDATSRVERRDVPNRLDAFLKSYDANGDRKVSADEWKAAGKDPSYFQLADANRDGALEADEIRNLPSVEYQVSTTETDLSVIQETIRKAFGDALQRRIRVDFDLLPLKDDKHATVPELGINLAETGMTRIEPNEQSPYRDLLEDYTGGVLFVIRPEKPMDERDVARRIREMRSQPDFAGQENRTEVVGLAPGSKEGAYSTLAILIRSGVALPADDARAWEDFAGKEYDLLEAALTREESMEALNFAPPIAREAVQRAIFAVVLSWLAIVAYLWLRFGSAQWGLAAVICLVHDVIIVVGLVAVSGWLHNTFLGDLLGIGDFKIDLAMVAAILTVIGYSVNDTIVVFDRIRENRGRLTTVTTDVINSSINQTLARTLLTSGTTFIVVLIMYVWGGPGIHAFSYALLAGIIFGTYSSVAVASPLLLGFKKALVAKMAPATKP